ncbi:MAG: CPBP family intramembrane metalloprotease [Alphaproteobacteria bacterium]|nr:CPBP family intramembrane metalloprotease [Alphaproteobacteria bacterium]
MIFKKIFLDTYAKHSKNQPFQIKILLVFLTSILSLVFINYFRSLNNVLIFIEKNGLGENFSFIIRTIRNFTDFQLLDLIYWALCIFFFYLIVPVIMIKWVFKEKLSEYGLALAGLTSGMKIYFMFLLFMLPLIWVLSYTDSFQQTYPFYKIEYSGTSNTHFFIWEGFYFLQFVGLEFFFRGFMLHALKKQFGFYAIFIMTIPYCMIHFQKPLPETIGAIFAGIILGTMSLKSNSIWLGVLLHFSVAIAMDCFSLMHR